MKWKRICQAPVMLVLFSVFYASCTKDNADNLKGSGTGIGAEKPIGNTLESAKTKVIGTGGGTITSRDGKLKISIPAGALNANTTIGVVAINSTSDAALGNSYRLTPHMTFAKPVTITISNKEHEDSTGGCGPGIGFQDSNGVWQMKINKSVNEQLKTVSIETDHFSDWALLTPFRLLPGYSLIRPNEEVILKLGAYVKIRPGSKDPCSFQNTGNTDHVAIEEYYIVPNDGIITWTRLTEDTSGAGKLTELRDGVSYKASNFDAPAINPVKILALFPSTIVPYQATIEVRPVSLGAFITIGSTTYVYDNAYAYGSQRDVGVVWQKTVGSETFYGNIGWTVPGTGVRNWSDDTQFHWEPEGPNPRLSYQSYWDDGLQISSGNVHITRFGAIGEIVEGTFTLTNAGMYRPESGSGDIEYLGIKPITGSFRVIRK